ncbi:MAG: hypothetical protein IJ403_01590 [Oscillospiraceae bacterium]|nr:hypothetical protein [Oscillospiraceae bacterium]
MNAWGLPVAATIGGVEYQINTDFRDVLEIIQYLNDNTRTEYARWRIALGLFYEGDIPDAYQEDAARYLSDFIAYDNQDDKPGPKLMDWQQDSAMIIADVNKFAGKEIRAEKYMHWWTFLSYFYGVGEGQLSTVVGIRSKKAKGKKLDKWEQEYYRDNRQKVDFQTPDTAEKAALQEYFNKWL